MYSQDLVFASVIIGSLSCLAFWLGSRVGPKSKGLFIGTVFVGAIFSIWFQGSLGWANLFPVSSAVLLSNLTPIPVAFVAGFACRGLNLRPAVRPFASVGLLLVCIICLMAPLIRPTLAPPMVHPLGESKGIVILQSHDSTCAPASAATLLGLHGIETSEREMVDACLTSEFGTEALGLYRGIKIGAKGHHRSVKIAQRDPDRWNSNGQLPNVALVRFAENEFGEGVADDRISETRPRRLTGPDSEDGHAVVVVGREGGKWKIADPAVGLVFWSDDEFRARFTGDAIFIAK